jgi:UDP:flavonoid glycosyltransferase YjiC (YdhE family)
MTPLARAGADAGHEIAFATAAAFCPQVEKLGFTAFAAGLSFSDQLEEAARRFPEQHAMPFGQDRFVSFVPRMLAGVAAPPRASELVPILRDWGPDVLVHEETEFGGPVAAAAAGIPYADHSVGILRPLEMARLARETIAPLWDVWDIDLGPYGGLFRYLYLDVCPPSLQAPEIDDIDVAEPMQNAHIDADGAPLPDWVDELRPVPTVYVSLGTLHQSREVFVAILEGLRDEDLEIIVTTGADADPSELGPQPDNVHVEGFIPQAALLPRCDLVINQGGTAILPILAHGLPLLIVPQAANQFHNAEACVAAGVGRSLLPSEVNAEAVRAAVRALREDRGYGERARALAREIEAMPGPEHGVRLLERLAQERMPLRGDAVHS